MPRTRTATPGTMTQMPRTRPLATVAAPRPMAKGQALGAVALDYQREDFLVRIRELTDGEGVDVVSDSLGGPISLRSFRALRPGGRLLMQAPNLLHAEAHLPERTWLAEGQAIDLIEQHWNAPTRRIDGTRRTIVESDAPEYAEAVPFQRRLYLVEELAEIFESVGLSLANVFDEDGAPCAPTDVQRELYVEARA